MSFNVILDFIRVYWREILTGSLTVLSFILCLIRKKPIKVVDSLRGQYMDLVLKAIRFAETTGLKGQDKLKFALDFIWSNLKDNVPECVSLDDIKSTLISTIETILETPQKK